MGEHEIRTESDDEHEDVFIIDAKAHPDYDEQLYTNDIAVFVLYRDVEFTGVVNIMSNPSKSECI